MNEVIDRQRHLLGVYAAYYESLSPETVDQLADLVTDDFVFCDPFTTVKGPKQVSSYLAKAFTDAENPSFVVTHRAVDGDMGFLRWHFSAKVPVIGQWDFTGMSEVTFNDDGTLLRSHTDHWDSGQKFYAKIPVLRWIIQRLARRVGSQG
ncbi:nuclear transport factor 2 family protein [Thalassospira australica]|uniref:nuclear transport factor 2 family protein n=1 Tax=Thalassospira australica TaxID=1528106 RepID=UPI00051A5E06|nr:nuclear transport factor 2 family protein [Thalassospira australica]